MTIEGGRMVRHFYCQLDFEDVPYSSPTCPGATVANNGCGVASTAMMVESMLDIPFPVAACADFFKQVGAGEEGGTNYYIASGAVAARFDLVMRHTEDMERVVEFFRVYPEGKAIANIRGDREGYTGVFSTGGHYVLVDGMKDGLLRVFDPMYRPGRYDIPGRQGKVKMDGFAAYVTQDVLKNDCFERPFFLFRKRA